MSVLAENVVEIIAVYYFLMKSSPQFLQQRWLSGIIGAAKY